MSPRPAFDRDGLLIEWDGCNCDVGRACNFPPCVMEQDLESRYWQRLYDAELRRQQDREITEVLTAAYDLVASDQATEHAAAGYDETDQWWDHQLAGADFALDEMRAEA